MRCGQMRSIIAFGRRVLGRAGGSCREGMIWTSRTDAAVVKDEVERFHAGFIHEVFAAPRGQLLQERFMYGDAGCFVTRLTSRIDWFQE